MLWEKERVFVSAVMKLLCVREKQAPSSANSSCLFCDIVAGGAQVALEF